MERIRLSRQLSNVIYLLMGKELCKTFVLQKIRRASRKRLILGRNNPVIRDNGFEHSFKSRDVAEENSKRFLDKNGQT
jgi:hypothetical protein